MRAALVLALLCACAVPLAAQELDIYDINDFVDPRELDRGSFLVSRAIAGGATSYLDVFRPTDAEVTFAHLATSYYRGRWQANWKHTQLNRESAAPVPPSPTGPPPVPAFQTPENKNTLQLARYFAVGRGESPSIIRIEATWTLAEYRQPVRGPRGPGELFSRYEKELGFEGDIPWRLGRHALVTSLVYVGRMRSENEPANRRITLLQRGPRLSLGRWSLDTAVAVGSIYAGDQWHGAMVQPSLHVISPTIPGVDARVHIKYAPAIGKLRPPVVGRREESETASQLAVFVDRALFAKLFRPSSR